jgi:hypothetical protein
LSVIPSSPLFKFHRYKGRRIEDHTKGTEYNLPHPKCKRSATATTFKPDKDEFRRMLKGAFHAKLCSIIKDDLKKNPKSDGTALKNEESQRGKVPCGTFETLDFQYGNYWAANIAIRLKLTTLSMYKDYIHDKFEEVFSLVKATGAAETKPGKV